MSRVRSDDLLSGFTREESSAPEARAFPVVIVIVVAILECSVGPLDGRFLSCDEVRVRGNDLQTDCYDGGEHDRERSGTATLAATSCPRAQA